MREPGIEAALELVAVAAEVALFGVLTTIGVLSEQIGLASVSGGDALGLWYVYVGTLALYAGVYVLGYQRLLGRLRERVGTA